MRDLITAEQAAEIRARSDQWNEWAKQYVQPNGWTVIPASAVPPVEITNEERGKLEQYDVLTNPPERLTGYVRLVDMAGNPSGYTDATVTSGCRVQIQTWTGDVLGEGRVTSLQSWRIRRGHTWRFSVRVRIAGVVYVGTAANGDGGCINLRRAKNQR